MLYKPSYYCSLLPELKAGTGPYLEFVFLPVDDDSCNLLVHEDEDGTKQSWDYCNDCSPPGVGPQRVDEPASVISGWLAKITKIVVG